MAGVSCMVWPQGKGGVSGGSEGFGGGSGGVPGGGTWSGGCVSAAAGLLRLGIRGCMEAKDG